MNAPAWRRALAAVVDLCVGCLPALIALSLWTSIIIAMGQELTGTGDGAGVLLYYGPLSALLSGYAVVWAYVVFRAHRGALALRSVGLVFSGIGYEDGVLRAAARPAHPARALALRVGAAIMATLSILATFIALYGVAGSALVAVLG